MGFDDESFAADTSLRDSAKLWQNEISKSIGALETIDPKKLQLTALMAAKIAGASPRDLDQHSILRVVEAAQISHANMETILADEDRIANKGQYFLTGTQPESLIYQQRREAAAAQIAVDEKLLSSYQAATDQERSRFLNEYSRISFGSNQQTDKVQAVGAAYLLGLLSMFPAASENTVERHDRNAFEQENMPQESQNQIKIEVANIQNKESEREMMQVAMQKREKFVEAAFQEWQKRKEQERRQIAAVQSADLAKNSRSANKWIWGSIGGIGGVLATVTAIS